MHPSMQRRELGRKSGCLDDNKKHAQFSRNYFGIARNYCHTMWEKCEIMQLHLEDEPQQNYFFVMLLLFFYTRRDSVYEEKSNSVKNIENLQFVLLAFTFVLRHFNHAYFSKTCSCNSFHPDSMYICKL